MMTIIIVIIWLLLFLSLVLLLCIDCIRLFQCKITVSINNLNCIVQGCYSDQSCSACVKKIQAQFSRWRWSTEVCYWAGIYCGAYKGFTESWTRILWIQWKVGRNGFYLTVVSLLHGGFSRTFEWKVSRMGSCLALQSLEPWVLTGTFFVGPWRL